MSESLLDRLSRRSTQWFLLAVARLTGRIPSGVGAGLRLEGTPATREYVTGAAERPVQRVLEGALDEGTVFYDVGANVGFFTVIAARLVGRSGRVYAFEPVPRNLELLRANVRANQFDTVDVVERAVADRDGFETLRTTKNPGGASLARGAGRPPDVQAHVEVETVRLDGLVERGEIAPPDVVKIDVEGAELAVLRGMKSLLEDQAPDILYEIDDRDEETIEARGDRIERWLAARGYRVSYLDDSYPHSAWYVRHGWAVGKD